MTDRKRDPLPEGYQFGDMGDPFARMSDEQKAAHCKERYVQPAMDSLRNRALTGSLDEEDRRMLRVLGWNVIEGERFASDAEQHPVIEGETTQ